MAAYFAATVRAPLTGIVLIIEMTNAHEQITPDITQFLVVSLQRAGKYQRLAWLLSQGQKGPDERVIMASQCPSHPW
jgi:H+/Cl- antiporter ClcA